MGQYDMKREDCARTKGSDEKKSCEDRTVTILKIKDTNVSTKSAGKRCNKKQAVIAVKNAPVSWKHSSKIFNAKTALHSRHGKISKLTHNRGCNCV
jgi:hypothetical protein